MNVLGILQDKLYLLHFEREVGKCSGRRVFCFYKRTIVNSKLLMKTTLCKGNFYLHEISLRTFIFIKKKPIKLYPPV